MRATASARCLLTGQVTSKASFVALASLRAPISHSTPCWSPGTPFSYSPHCWSLGALDQLVGGHGPRGTLNMWLMSVTLDVSRLRGWLKADAYCRVEGRACAMRGEGWAGPAGGREAKAAQVARFRAGSNWRLREGTGHARNAPQTCLSWS